jgi:HEAT repeat protein
MVRKNAAWALGNLADKCAVVVLTESLKDADAEVWDAAQAALVSISGTKTSSGTDE